MSEEKITRSSKIYQQKLSIDTEKITSRFRKTFKKHEDCLKGNAIINLKLLNDAISTAAIFSSCKNPQSQLTLRELRSNRKGLAHRFYLHVFHALQQHIFILAVKTGRMRLILMSSQCMQSVKELA